MADQNPKQQIVDKLRDVDTVMVTVNSNPSVDELSAALGFTLLLNKINKHATAIFSGDIPPAITFLDPEKTFENTVNSLRDFIIALDKEKADHLRYKVDGDVVKIFITPYRTTITQDDLEFTQGDYNVEMVVALGVRDEQDLDRALSEHGKIMHDATVASISIGSDSSELGSISWHESDASSYSEVLVALAESLRSDKKLIDEQIATAFLTGIVAATDRFSNNQTSSKVMTMAAQLMAAGANQQLIATQLEEASEIPSRQQEQQPPATDNDVPERQGAEPPRHAEPVKDQQRADGTMQISHEPQGDIDEVASQIEQRNQADAVEKVNNSLHDSELDGPEGVFARQYGARGDGANKPTIDDLRRDIEEAHADENQLPPPPPPVTQDNYGRNEMSLPPLSSQVEPMMGGTLNATADQALQDRRREEESDRNRQVLNHGGNSAQYVAAPPTDFPSLNAFDGGSSSLEDNAQSNGMPEFEPLDREMHTHAQTIEPPSQTQQQEALPPAPSTPSFGEMGHDDARAAIESALQSGPPPDPNASLGPMPEAQLPMPAEQQVPAPQPSNEMSAMPPMPDFSTLPPMPGAEAPAQPQMPAPVAPAQQLVQPVDQQVIAADPSVDLPPLPSAPDMAPAEAQPMAPVQQQPQSNDPGQFQIPTPQP